MSDAPLIRIGVSSCLMGAKVRFDGNHKQDTYVSRVLAEHFEMLPVCPEAAIGMGIPRPPIQLVGEADAPRALGVADKSLDVTDQLVKYGRRMAREMTDISGYILKNRSPSCGMERVKLYRDNGYMEGKKAVGLYARQIMLGQPLLPVEEEGRLNDPQLRDSFLERVFAYRRWQDLNAGRISAAKLVQFHTVHKLTLMAHGTEYYRRLGQLVATAGKGRIREVADEYITQFMQALAHKATPRRHTNVLQHILGYLKRNIDTADKQELLAAIEAFRLGRAPRIVPVTLLRHHFMRQPNDYIAGQYYLYPPANELVLRSGL